MDRDPTRVETAWGAPTDSREHPRPKPDQNLAKSVVLQDPQDFPAAPPTAPKGQCPEGAHRELGPRNMSHCGWLMACTIGEVMCQPSHPPCRVTSSRDVAQRTRLSPHTGAIVVTRPAVCRVDLGVGIHGTTPPLHSPLAIGVHGCSIEDNATLSPGKC